jgi:hypothetical protein
MKTKQDMDVSISDCLVTGYEPLIHRLVLPDENDRHILAAAITCHAEFIVTFNQKDFPPDSLIPFEIQTVHPDDFILDLFDIDEFACLRMVARDIAHYKAPPLTIDDYLASLEKAGVPKTAAYLRARKIIFE